MIVSGNNGREDEIEANSGCILKVEPTVFAYGLDTSFERKPEFLVK